MAAILSKVLVSPRQRSTAQVLVSMLYFEESSAAQSSRRDWVREMRMRLRPSLARAWA